MIDKIRDATLALANGGAHPAAILAAKVAYDIARGVIDPQTRASAYRLLAVLDESMLGEARVAELTKARKPQLVKVA